MSSTDLITYLNYISTWETESDANIDSLISEINLFVKLDDFESDSIVDKEFNYLSDLAGKVEEDTIAADAIQIAADAAAVASIYSFGLGMAAFAALETAETIEKAMISSKSKELNEKLNTADTDISSQINDDVLNYVSKYKANNDLIISKAPKGLDTRTSRSNLLQFMSFVQRTKGTIDATTFRTYAGSARIAYNSEEIQKVYDALDQLNFSDKSDDDVRKFMNVLVGLDFDDAQLSLIRNISIAIMFYKLNIANKTIETQAKEAGLPVEEVDANAFETLDAVGKFTTAVAVVLSVVDVILNILDIVDIVQQYRNMKKELNGTIKENYKSYFNGIKTSAKKYKAAIS